MVQERFETTSDGMLAMKCKYCNGSGYDYYSHSRTCKACKGTGKQSILLPVLALIGLIVLLIISKMTMLKDLINWYERNHLG